MMNLINKKKAEEGFTLIELMIVVAIIGILAAIAIPQFAAYRIRAFNSAAESDMRNAKLAEEALFADFQSYGTTQSLLLAPGIPPVNGAAIAPGVLLPVAGAPNAATTTVAGNAISAGATASIAVGISSNVLLEAVVFGAYPSPTANMAAKHTQGDRTFAMDTDGTALFFRTGTAPDAAGLAMAAGTALAALPNAVEFVAPWTAR